MDQSAIAELTSFPVVHFRKGDSIFDYDENPGEFVYYLAEGYAMRQVTTIAGEEIFFEEYHPAKLSMPCSAPTSSTQRSRR